MLEDFYGKKRMRDATMRLAEGVSVFQLAANIDSDGEYQHNPQRNEKSKESMKTYSSSRR
jgi:hypothetical protein